MNRKPTGGNISFSDMYESMDHMNEAKVAVLKDDKLKKLYNQMKDEQLSGSAAMQFKDIVREMKKRNISLTEAKKVKIVTTGNGEMKKYQLMVPDGSELIDMEFTSPAEAKKFAKKKGFQLTEGSTEDAAKSLDAIIGAMEKRKDKSGTAGSDVHKSILKMGKGIKDNFKKKGSFSPDQAKWIWKTSVALFK